MFRLFAIVCLLFSTSLQAEEIKFNELVNWLPDGPVYRLTWTDARFHQFEKCLSLSKRRSELPLVLKHFDAEAVHGYVSTEYCNGKITEQDQMKRRGRSGISVTDGSGKAYVMDMTQSYAMVAAVDNLALMMSGLRKKNLVEPTGEKAGQYPTFSFLAESSRAQKEVAYFLCPTDVDILLIAQTNEMLETMVKTGMGEGISLVESKPVTVALEFGGRVKHGFFLKNEYGWREHLFDLIGSSPYSSLEDYDSPAYRISGFNHDLCHRYEINVYSKEELAQKELEGWRQARINGAQGDPFADREFRKVQQRHQTFEVQDTSFILTLHFTEEYKKANEEAREAAEEMQKSMKKQRKTPKPPKD